MAGGQQQLRRSTACSSKSGQCHVISQGMQLNTDLSAWCYASAVLAVARCLCVSVSPESHRNGWTDEADFWRGGFLWLAHAPCVLRKFGYLKMSALFSNTLSQTMNLENFATACRLSQHVSSTKMGAQRDKLATVVGQTKLTVLAAFDRWPCPVHHTERLALLPRYTARYAWSQNPCQQQEEVNVE